MAAEYVASCIVLCRATVAGFYLAVLASRNRMAPTVIVGAGPQCRQSPCSAEKRRRRPTVRCASPMRVTVAAPRCAARFAWPGRACPFSRRARRPPVAWARWRVAAGRRPLMLAKHSYAGETHGWPLHHRISRTASCLAGGLSGTSRSVVPRGPSCPGPTVTASSRARFPPAKPPTC
jgi:hypothetical protein